MSAASPIPGTADGTRTPSKPGSARSADAGDRVTCWAFVCLALFLLGSALTLGRPGLPRTLVDGEPTTFLIAASLALDRDLQPRPVDLERLFRAYTFTAPVSIELAAPIGSPDGAEGRTGVDWRSARYHQPLAYPLLAAPLVALLGANGFYVLNVTLFLGTLGLLGRMLPMSGGDAGGRVGRREPALLLPALGLILSAAFPYLFRLHPAWLHAFLLTAALAPLLRGLAVPQLRASPRRTVATGVLSLGAGESAFRRLVLPATFAGACLALAIGATPAWALLAPAAALAARPVWRSWAVGLALGGLLALALAAPLRPAALGAEGDAGLLRAEFRIEGPWELPWADAEASPRSPEPTLGEPVRGHVFGALAQLGLALFERRVGFVPYFPVTLLALALAWRARRRWSPADRALLFGLALLVLAQPWIAPGAAGGELLSNPALVALSPLFFLLPRARVGPMALSGAALVGMVLLGPAWISALGPTMAFGDPQGHTRSPLLSRLPLDLGHVGRGDGYRPWDLGRVATEDPSTGTASARLWIPRHATEQHGSEVWLLGSSRTELFLDARSPLGPTHWRVRNLAPGNRAELEVAGQTVRFAWPEDLGPAGDVTDARFELGEGARVQASDGLRHVWRLRVETQGGERPAWRRGLEEDFYLGLGLALLGTEGHLRRDVYGTRWYACEAPEAVQPEETFLALARVKNASSEAWNATGAARIRLAHRWRGQDGSLVAEGQRTELPEPIPPGGELTAWAKVEAPSRPGVYTLALEMIYENVDWFTRIKPDSDCRATVRVEPAAD